MSETLVAETTTEQRRLAALHGYEVLDTAPESDFDDIAVLAAQLCRTPLAAVSLVAADRQWFKARQGPDLRETARDHSFCSHAMYADDIMQVPDALLDPRFRDNPLVTGAPHVRFYAGVPLVTATGHPLGTLCVIDHEPRLLGPAECRGLRILARHVIAQLELRQYARGLDEVNERLRDADQVKDAFLRTPPTPAGGHLDMLGEQGPSIDGDGTGFRERIRRNSDRLMALVDDVLLAAQSGRGATSLHRRSVDLAGLAAAAAEQNRALATARGLTITAEAPEPVTVQADEQRLGQALERLVLNAVKFTPRGEITIRVVSRDADVVLEVSDTGVGMSDEDLLRVLAPVRRSATGQRGEGPGAGLGLSIVKAIAEGHGGTLAIRSKPGQGTTISMALPRFDAAPESGYGA